MEPAAKDRLEALQHENELLREANAKLKDGVATVGMGYLTHEYSFLRKQIETLQIENARFKAFQAKAEKAFKALKEQRASK